jgi:hypothetical protein
MNPAISKVVSLLALHADLSESQSKQLIEISSRLDISADDKALLKQMGKLDADTAALLRRAIKTLNKASASNTRT